MPQTRDQFGKARDMSDSFQLVPYCDLDRLVDYSLWFYKYRWRIQFVNLGYVPI